MTPKSILAGGILLALVAAPATAQIDVDLLAGMKARSLGPAGMSGRVAAVEGSPTDPRILYIGAASGGIWKSQDAGLTFQPIFDDQPVHAIGALAVSPLSPDVLWVGTGEGNVRNSVSFGNGVYRSLDGGETFQHLGLEHSERIPKIVLHPTDPDTAWVAALGAEWGENDERGVYRTRDGGMTWEQVLFVDERTGCVDLVIDPRNPDKLFAALWDYRRWPWSFRSGGPGSGLHVTRDGGDTWERLTAEDGLPAGELGRIGLAIAPSDPNRVYAIVECKKNAIVRSDDGGKTWSTMTTEGSFGNRPFYYSQLRVDPERPDRLYSLWSSVSMSIDGGRNWEVIVPFASVHPDHHALWINPNDPEHLVDGNDGGVAISRDRGRNWRFVANLPLAQYYHVAVDMDVPYHVYGGMQDNGSWRGPSQVWENGGIRNHHWEEVGFGDGFDTQPTPDDSGVGYAMSQEGYLMRWDLLTGGRKRIRPWGPPDVPLRFNWDAPLALDPFDDNTLYFGSQFLHVSHDRGDTWEIASPDLTTDNPEWQKQAESGGLTLDVTGAENFVTLQAIAPSPLEQGLIWVGTDDGRVWRTDDAAGTWQNLDDRVTGVPDHTWVAHIEASRHDAATAYVMFDDHRRSNRTPYVMRTRDGGQTWSNLAGDQVQGYALYLVEDPVQPGLLYLGTETGLYVSLDDGVEWLRWTHGLPTASCMSLVVHPRDHDLVIGTHGRAAFVLDDIRPLRELSAEVLAETVHLFPVPDAIQYTVKQTGASRFPGDGEFRGENRPYGALITFSLNGVDLPRPGSERTMRNAGREEGGGDEGAGDDKEEGDGTEVRILVRDAAGEVVRRMEVEGHLGVNRIAWNLTRDPFRSLPREGQGGRGGRGGGSGHPVLPGTYTLSLEFAGEEVTGSVQVLADPRSSVSQAARQARWQSVRRMGDLMERAADAVERILEVRRHVTFVQDLVRVRTEQYLREHPDADKEDAPLAGLDKAAKELLKVVKETEELFRTTEGAQGIVAEDHAWSKIGLARGALTSSWDAPGTTEQILLDQAESALTDAVGRLDALVAGEVVAFRVLVTEAGLELLPGMDPLGR